jgi:hypothetical protein
MDNKYIHRWYYDTKGFPHREDGPALIYPNGQAYWYLHGTLYTFNEYLKLTPIPDEQKLLLRLQYD